MDSPVHEVLEYDGVENVITTDEITLNHYPDSTKPRSSYLPLLELSIKESPFDDRNMHYLGREYMYYGKWNESIDTLIKHLKLPTTLWKDERCASMRFIGRCYMNLERYDEAELWYDKAIKEARYLRDPYIERAFLTYELKDWQGVQKYCIQALKITKHTKSYINEVFSWNETVYDLLSLSSYYLKDLDSGLKWLDDALKINPTDERLLANKSIITKQKNGD